MAGHCGMYWPMTRTFCCDKCYHAEVEGGRWGKENKIAFAPFDIVLFGSLWSKHTTTFSGGLCATHFLALSLKHTPGQRWEYDLKKKEEGGIAYTNTCYESNSVMFLKHPKLNSAF